MEAEVVLFCEGEEVNRFQFKHAESGEKFFDEYPLDEFADHAELYGFDCFGDWEMLDERNSGAEE